MSNSMSLSLSELRHLQATIGGGSGADELLYRRRGRREKRVPELRSLKIYMKLGLGRSFYSFTCMIC